MTDATTRTSLAPAASISSQLQITAEQAHGGVQYEARPTGASTDGVPWSVALGYRRFREFDLGNHTGQDWCAVGASATHCVGVVADGVSQSFMGDIAAQRAGAALWQQLMEHPHPFVVGDVRDWFERFGKNIHTAVAGYTLSPALPEMVKTSLEGKRTQHGSQTVLAAFSLDFATRRAHLILIGDVRVVVHHDDGRVEHIASDARGRWSSVKGLRGEPLVAVVEGVSAIVLFSDGLETTFGDVVARSFDAGGFHITAEAAAERDDVSLVAVARLAELPRTAPPDGTTRTVGVPSFSPDDPQEKTTVRGPVALSMPVLDQSPRLPGVAAMPATVVAPPSVPSEVRALPSPPFAPGVADVLQPHEPTVARPARDARPGDFSPSAPSVRPAPLPPTPTRSWGVVLSWLTVAVAVVCGISIIALMARAIVSPDDSTKDAAAAPLQPPQPPPPSLPTPSSSQSPSAPLLPPMKRPPNPPPPEQPPQRSNGSDRSGPTAPSSNGPNNINRSDELLNRHHRGSASEPGSTPAGMQVHILGGPAIVVPPPSSSEPSHAVQPPERQGTPAPAAQGTSAPPAQAASAPAPSARPQAPEPTRIGDASPAAPASPTPSTAPPPSPPPAH